MPGPKLTGYGWGSTKMKGGATHRCSSFEMDSSAFCGESGDDLTHDSYTVLAWKWKCQAQRLKAQVQQAQKC